MEQSLSILIVEDNPGDRLLLDQYLTLTELEINNLAHAPSLSASQDVLQRMTPSLIFLDLFLPDSDGLMTFLRLNEWATSIPIVILTGLADSETAVKAIKSGAQDYLIKGEFDEKVLSKAIVYSIERKKVQESLNQTLEIHELISKATKDVIWDWNMQSNCVRPLSESFEDNFGYTMDESGYPVDWWLAKIEPSTRNLLQQKVENLIANGSNKISHEFKFLDSNSEYRDVYARALLLYKSTPTGQRVYRSLGVIQDITELKNTQEKLLWSLQRYETISKATSDVIYDWNITKDQVQYWQEDIEKVFGYGGIEVVPASWWYEKLHPDDLSTISKEIENAFKNQHSQAITEFRFRCADGKYKYVYGKAYYFYDDAGQPYRAIGAMQDITKLKVLQNRMIKERILRQKQITEATIQSQEAEREELGRELHDNVNQILATVRMFIDLSIKQSDMRDEVLPKSYEHLSLAIEELRKLSKSLVPPSLGDVGLKEAVTELLALIDIEGKLSVVFDYDIPAHVKLSNNLQLMIYRIIQEQLNNIKKYAHATEVNVLLTVEDPNITLCISDNGIGFDTSKRAKGIGLRNIKSRIDLYKGKMTLDSSPGSGCALKVSIPFNS